MKLATLSLWSLLAVGAWAFATIPGCSSSSKSTTSTSEPSGSGVCDDKCLKECGSDNDCATSDGELCCDFGDGKACTDAKNCPRFCGADKDCKTADGEACLRTTLASSESVCTDPGDSLHLCKADGDCKSDEVCCGIYSEPVCLKADRCPQACKKSSDCNTDNGEVCCTTLKKLDPTLAADGLCVDPQTTTCPTACSKSSDCDTKHGELCCNGLCATSCQQECQTSSDCDGQVCCRSAAEKSPWVGGVQEPGYAVAAPTGSSGSGGTGSGGTASGGTGSGTGGTASGGKGGTASADCETCSAAVAANDLVGSGLCAGKSSTLWHALADCTCTGACATDCTSFCASGTRDDTCDGCVAASCTSQFLACQGD